MVIRMLGLVDLSSKGRPAFRVNEDEDYIPPRDGEPQDPEAMEMGAEDPGAQMSPKAALMQINKQSAELFNIVNDDGNFEEWVEEKLRTAADLINSIHGHVSYETKKPDSLPQGTETVMAQTRNY